MNVRINVVKFVVIVSAFFIIGGTSTVYANEVVVTQKLVPPSNSEFPVQFTEGFGHSVDISDSRIAVAYRVRDSRVVSGNSSFGSEGGAHLFELNGATEWDPSITVIAFESKFDLSVSASGLNYAGPLSSQGNGMSMDGDSVLLGVPSGSALDGQNKGWIFVGDATGEDTFGNNEGTAYIREELFSYDTTKIGSMVALHGDYFASQSLSTNGVSGAKGIHLFKRNSQDGWDRVAQFSSSACSICLNIPSSLTLDEKHMAAGAITGSGVVDLYNFNQALEEWSHIQTLSEPDDRFFGTKTALDNDTLAVRGLGRVVLYKFEAGQWNESAVITQRPGEFMIGAVALEGSILAVGAVLSSGQNIVLVYTQSSDGQWNYDRTLVPYDSDQSGSDGFGFSSMAMENGALVIGRDTDTEFGASNGSAYVYSFSGVITSPVPGTTLTDNQQTFEWSLGDSASVNFRLTVGSTLGGTEYFDSGSIGAVTSVTATGLPNDASTLYVRLWYQDGDTGDWNFIDYQYTASGTVPLPTVTSPAISRGILLDELSYTVDLSTPLPAGFGVFLNFDNQEGGWYAQNQDGGHFALTQQSGSIYSERYIFNRPGLRSVRAGIFQLGARRDEDVLIGSYSEGVLCTERVCIEGITQHDGIGNPEVSQSGSKSFRGVDVASGNYHFSTVDLGVMAEGIPFVFSRAYNSLSSIPWTFGYEARVRYITGSNQRELSVGPKADGRYQYYFKEMDHLGGDWHPLDVGNFDKLMENSDGSFTQYTRGNEVYKFSAPDETSSETTGYLTAIEDRLGYGLQLFHSSGKLDSIVDSNGKNYSIQRNSNGQIASVTDSANRTVSYSYNSAGLMTAFTNARGFTTNYRYTSGASDSKLNGIIDPRQNTVIDLTYNADGQVNMLGTAVGEITTFIYDRSDATDGEATGVVRDTVDGINHSKIYLLDDMRQCVVGVVDAENAGDFRSSIDREGATSRGQIARTCLVSKFLSAGNLSNGFGTSYSYTDDGRGNVIARELNGSKSLNTELDYRAERPNQPNLRPLIREVRAGINTPRTYNNFTETGNPGAISDSRGYTTNRRFDDNDWLTEHTDALGRSTAYTYYPTGLVESMTDALGGTAAYEYDSIGRKVKETSSLGLVTRYTYDSNGNLTSRNEKASGIDYSTSYEYDQSDNLTLVIDPIGLQINYTYDAMNRRISESYTVDGVTFTKTFHYDAVGRMDRITDQRNNTERTQFTARSLVSRRVNGRGEIESTITYDKNGNVKIVTDGEGRQVSYEYDVLNRRVSATDSDNDTVTWQYDDASRLSLRTDKQGRRTAYEYDNEGNLVKTIDANGGVTQAQYDEVGNVISIIDPNNNTSSYTYDALNRRILSVFPDGQTWRYEYDANGNLINEETATGEVIEQQFDALNRVTQRVERSSRGGAVLRQIEYTYDANNNVINQSEGGQGISYQYDAINRVTSVTDQYGQTVGYGYDKASNRTSLIYPGGLTVEYQYDQVNRLISLEDWLGNETTYIRNTAGQVEQILNSNGTETTYEYDSLGRTLNLDNNSVEGASISSHSVTYDTAGNISFINAEQPLRPQIISEITEFNYDANNFIESSNSAALDIDDAGRLIEQNQSGLRTTYEFNVNDLITEVNQDDQAVASYEYDLQNNRIMHVRDGAETRYVIDQLAQLPSVIAEIDAQGTVSVMYVYGEGLVSKIDTNDAVKYYHFDQTGHTVALTDNNGNITDSYAYTPYGETRSVGDTDNPFKFVGRFGVMDDGNGLHYMRARYYRAGVSRFLTLDDVEGGMARPKLRNRYAYGVGNPISYIDPTGLTCEAIPTDSLDTPNRYSITDNVQLGIECPKFAPNTNFSANVTVTAPNRKLNDLLREKYYPKKDETALHDVHFLVAEKSISGNAGIETSLVDGDSSLGEFNASIGGGVETKGGFGVDAVVSKDEVNFGANIGACASAYASGEAATAGIGQQIKVSKVTGACVGGSWSWVNDNDEVGISVAGVFSYGIGGEFDSLTTIDKKYWYEFGGKVYQWTHND